MARVPYRHRPDADVAEQYIYDRLEVERKHPTPNIFLALAHAPTQLDGLLTYARTLRSATELGPRLRELVILGIAAAKGGEYVAEHHKHDALKAGLTEQQVDAIARNAATYDLFESVEVAVIDFGREIGGQDTVTHQTWTTAAQHLTQRQLVQLTMTACWYSAGVLMMRILDLDLEDP
ncbi:carboxymuconolactone decarboxylase family protein [Rhodococcus sp. LB1]|uniref:carboxymuconolactone decarboxylase family protein n=1 Tax=Rhodococcus sp. LB1 TaxID=1807499 RepID=UPI00077A3218|nr:carboxymuconolactone decarboxylase family protein [Rhodococcus sp. LB1]KXX55907.1 hypothetical protein AZG88_02440 [Rhodococcus sp. LB1]